MAEIKRSDPYVLPQTQGRYVTEVVDSKNYTIVEISNVDTALAYSVDGVLSTSSSASDNFKNNLAQGTYNSTINNSINKTLGITSNTQNPNQPGTPGGSTSTSPPNQNTGDSDPILKYPLKMKPEQDKIKFQACKIKQRGAAATTGSNFSFPSPEYETVDGPVILAIQSPISDQNSVDWGPDSMNAIDAFIYQQSRKFMTKNPNEVFKETTKGILDAFGSNRERILNYLAGQAASLNNVLARTDNVVLNPNLELLFQGPQLRPFTFTFKMSARSQPEADKIKKIIKYFKYHMAVRKETGLFLRAPHVFTIRYLKGETDNHPGINLISPTDDTKACALTNCSVDYTPLGSYATYEDGTMVAYTLSLQFQELTPIYDTDYTQEPAASHPIGY